MLQEIRRRLWFAAAAIVALVTAPFAGASTFDIPGLCAPAVSPVFGGIAALIVAAGVIVFLGWESTANLAPDLSLRQPDGRFNFANGLRWHAFFIGLVVFGLLCALIAFSQIDQLLQSLHVPGGAALGIQAATDPFATPDQRGTHIQEAVNAPRFHNQWLPDQISVEHWFSPDTIQALERMGNKVEVGATYGEKWEPYWSDGECIEVDLKSGERLGASDGRNNGKAVGY